MPTVDVILDNAPAASVLAANDIDRGALYGKRLDQLLPQKIYAHYFVLKKIYDNSGVLVEVDATGIITITDSGSEGDGIVIHVSDPNLGAIVLGTYTVQSIDTDAIILAENIAANINDNPYGYSATSENANINITARIGLGDNINGGGRLTVVLTPVETFYILSESGNRLITETGGNYIVLE